jgi:hypothetical protein
VTGKGLTSEEKNELLLKVFKNKNVGLIGQLKAIGVTFDGLSEDVKQELALDVVRDQDPTQMVLMSYLKLMGVTGEGLSYVDKRNALLDVMTSDKPIISKLCMIESLHKFGVTGEGLPIEEKGLLLVSAIKNGPHLLDALGSCGVRGEELTPKHKVWLLLAAINSGSLDLVRKLSELGVTGKGVSQAEQKELLLIAKNNNNLVAELNILGVTGESAV